jgi:hypothetical protein
MVRQIGKQFFLLGWAAVSIGLSGCVSYRESNTVRTPEEQALLSRAVDNALDGKMPSGLVGRRVFLDVTNLDCADRAYVTDAVRQGLATAGARIVGLASEADAVVTVRAGMLATQAGASLLGVPSIKVPLPLGSSTVETPEVALFKRATQEGLARLCLTAYDNDTHELISAQEGVARTHFDRWHVLFIVHFNRTNVPELTLPLSSEK